MCIGEMPANENKHHSKLSSRASQAQWERFVDRIRAYEKGRADRIDCDSMSLPPQFQGAGQENNANAWLAGWEDMDREIREVDG